MLSTGAAANASAGFAPAGGITNLETLMQTCVGRWGEGRRAAVGSVSLGTSATSPYPLPFPPISYLSASFQLTATSQALPFLSAATPAATLSLASYAIVSDTPVASPSIVRQSFVGGALNLSWTPLPYTYAGLPAPPASVTVELRLRSYSVSSGVRLWEGGAPAPH